MSIIKIKEILVVLCCVIATACDGSKAPEQGTAPESKVKLENQEDHINLTDGTLTGFYGEDSVALTDPRQAITKSSDTTFEQKGKLSQGGSNDNDSSSPSTQSDNPGALVSEMGFSNVQEEITVAPPIPAYCLSDVTTPTEENHQQACKQISDRLASVSTNACNSAKLQPSGCRSVQGFPILVREFPPLAAQKPQGRILLVGGTHGDELTSVSVAFRWIEKLNKHHSGLFHWHIAPMMNPDGVLKRAASRTNSNGVDLNRNMPSDDWQNTALSYWENKVGRDPRKYPGTSPSSEPETQWLIDEINTFKPDAIISIHAPYGVVDFDALLLNTAPKSLGKLHLNLLGTYPGSLGNYAGINRDIPVITLELPHAWEMPSENETTKIWEDIVSWLKTNVDTRDLNISAQTNLTD